MPSLFEPCGISQMLAMRNGVPCLVHHSGGLKDTVEHMKTGFSFDGDGDSHNYFWSFTSIPQNSMAVIASPNLAVTSFVADQVGLYNVLLVVDDGDWDDIDTIIVTCYNSSI